MKSKKLVGLFFVLGVVTAIINACGPSNSPTNPVAPANTATFTPTCGNATGTCTAPPTSTFTNTATNSPTATPSSTATDTPTKTITATATNSPTPSPTRTASNTSTVTPTKTPTNTPTDSPTTTPTNTPCTCTMTPTATDSPTSSSTNTPTITPTTSFTLTPTVTICNTQTNTPTVVTAQGFSVSVTFTGAGVVSAAHPIRFYIWGSGGPNSGNGDNRSVTTNGGSLTYYTGSASTGGFAAWYDAVGNGINQPQPSDYGVIYNIGTCNLGAWTTITVSGGAITNLGTVSFGATNLFYGFGGAVTYQGSAGGSVDGCHPLVVGMYSDPGYTTGVNSTQNTFSNGGPYCDFDSGLLCSSNSYYFRAWYAKSGNTNSPQAGDPVTQLGLKTTVSTANMPVTIP